MGQEHPSTQSRRRSAAAFGRQQPFLERRSQPGAGVGSRQLSTQSDRLRQAEVGQERSLVNHES